MPEKLPVTIDTKLANMGQQIGELLYQYNERLRQTHGEWSILGKAAPLLRGIFHNARLPIQSIKDLTKQLGGEEQLIIVHNLDYGIAAATVKDLINAIKPILRGKFPIKSWKSVVIDVIRWQKTQRARNKVRELLPNRLANDTLRSVLKDRDKRRLLHPQRRKHSDTFELIRLSHDRLARSPLGQGRHNNAHAVLFNHFAMTQMSRSRTTGNSQADAYLNTVAEVVRAIQVAYERAYRTIADAADARKRRDAALALVGSATVYLDQADLTFNRIDTLVTQVLGSSNIDQAENLNSQLDAQLDLILSLFSQALADIALAETEASHIPEDGKAQNAVAAVRARYLGAQAKYTEALDKVEDAEAYKDDVLGIRLLPITVHCHDQDWCCGADVPGATVRITNLSNANVDVGIGVTDASGHATITGRFGESDILVETFKDNWVGELDWDQTRYATVGDMPPPTIRVWWNY